MDKDLALETPETVETEAQEPVATDAGAAEEVSLSPEINLEDLKAQVSEMLADIEGESEGESLSKVTDFSSVGEEVHSDTPAPVVKDVATEPMVNASVSETDSESGEELDSSSDAESEEWVDLEDTDDMPESGWEEFTDDDDSEVSEEFIDMDDVDEESSESMAAGDEVTFSVDDEHFEDDDSDFEDEDTEYAPTLDEEVMDAEIAAEILEELESEGSGSSSEGGEEIQESLDEEVPMDHDALDEYVNKVAAKLFPKS